MRSVLPRFRSRGLVASGIRWAPCTGTRRRGHPDGYRRYEASNPGLNGGFRSNGGRCGRYAGKPVSGRRPIANTHLLDGRQRHARRCSYLWKGRSVSLARGEGPIRVVQEQSATPPTAAGRTLVIAVAPTNAHRLRIADAVGDTAPVLLVATVAEAMALLARNAPMAVPGVGEGARAGILS